MLDVESSESDESAGSSGSPEAAYVVAGIVLFKSEEPGYLSTGIELSESEESGSGDSGSEKEKESIDSGAKENITSSSLGLWCSGDVLV